MPGLDFQRLRSEIPMTEVLELLGFVATNGSGDQLYGPCWISADDCTANHLGFSVGELRSMAIRKKGTRGEATGTPCCATGDSPFESVPSNEFHKCGCGRRPRWVIRGQT